MQKIQELERKLRDNQWTSLEEWQKLRKRLLMAKLRLKRRSQEEGQPLIESDNEDEPIMPPPHLQQRGNAKITSLSFYKTTNGDQAQAMGKGKFK